MAAEKRVSLPARHELKYYINDGELEVLRARLQPVLDMDPHCVNGEPYIIRSLYFDDINDSAYYDKVAGTMHRDKYRIRIYKSWEKDIFLERKRKMGDLIQKSSVQISKRLCEQLMAGDPRGLQNSSSPLLQDVYVQMRLNLLRPAVIVDYKREVYLHPVEDVRITFDLDVRSGLHSTDLFNKEIPTVPVHDRNVQILEVKFNNYLPSHIKGLLDGIECERSAVSKYILCRRYEPLGR